MPGLLIINQSVIVVKKFYTIILFVFVKKYGSKTFWHAPLWQCGACVGLLTDRYYIPLWRDKGFQFVLFRWNLRLTLELNTVYTKVNSWRVELFKSLILALCFFFAVILPMYAAEKRAAAAARKRFILDPFSDHLVFVQVFRVSYYLWCRVGTLQ